MATKAMSEMTVPQLIRERDAWLDMAGIDISLSSKAAFLILANQYDAELTRRREGKTI